MIIVTDEMVSQFKAGFHGSTLNDDQVRRGLASVFLHRGLYDASALMADGGDTIMTAAEEVLAWLLIEKIGVPDDVSYSPDQAQQIIADRLGQNPAPAANVVGLSPDEKHIGVILSSVKDGSDSRVSVKEWSDNSGIITFGMFMGNHQWIEGDFLPDDAAKIAALILGKPSVAALSAANEGE